MDEPTRERPAAPWLTAALDALREHGLDGLGPWLADDFELHVTPSIDGTAVFRGRAALDDVRAALARTHIAVTERVAEWLVLDDGRLLGIGTTTTSGHGRGGHASLRCWIVEIDPDRIVAATAYEDQDAAREAAGLAPEAWPRAQRFTDRAGLVVVAVP